MAANSFSDLTPEVAPVLVFDSGVGGLSIVQALRKRLPSLPLVYACDNAAFPYGEKSAAWLQQRLHKVIGQLILKVEPCLIIIACNTASTLALSSLRQHFSLPFVGVVPAIKPAALITQSGTLGLLATQGTLNRTYTQQLIAKFAPDCQIIKLGSNQLVQLAENFIAGQEVNNAALEEILEPFFAQERLDTVILGCTHFPLLQPQLALVAEKRLGTSWQWVDSGAAIARRVAQLLETGVLDTAALNKNSRLQTAAVNTCWLTQALAPASRLPQALQTYGFFKLNYLL